MLTGRPPSRRSSVVASPHATTTSSAGRTSSPSTPTLSRPRSGSGMTTSGESLRQLEKAAAGGTLDTHNATPPVDDIKPKRFLFEDELEALAKRPSLCIFPSDDLEVVSFLKRDTGNKGPEPGTDEFKKLEPSSAEAVAFYRAPWRAVTRNHAAYKSVAKEAGKEEEADLAGLMEPIEAVAAENTNSDPVGFEYLRDQTAMAEAAARRNDGRSGVVKRTVIGAHWSSSPGEAVIGGRVLSAPKDPSTLKSFNQTELQTRFMVKPKSWALGFGVIEPFFFRMAVYDVAACAKVSEDVWFDVNSSQVKNLVPHLARKEPHLVLSGMQFVFSVPPSPSLYLVVSVLKIPDVDSDSAAVYAQSDKTSATASERHRANVAEFCFHNGQHSQLFAWTAVRIFNESSAFVLDEAVELTDFRLFTPKTVLLDEIANLQSTAEVAATRTISLRAKPKTSVSGAKLDLVAMKLPPGRLVMSRNMYDSSMRRVMLSDANGAKEKIPETQPLYIAADFPVIPTLSPFLDLVHNAYVYPIKADVSKYLVSKEARGLGQVIGLRVSFHESDSDASSLSGLPVFYGKSHEDMFVSAVTSSIGSGSSTKNLFWYDELKLKLPLVIRERAHLRFTFLSLSAPAKKDDEGVEKILGWAWLFVAPGMVAEQTLKVFYGRKVPPNYTKQTDSPDGIGSLAVQFKFVSSLVPLDAPLCKLYKIFHFKEFFLEDEMQATLDAVARRVSPVEAIKHMPVVLPALLRIMCTRSNGSRPCEVLLTVLVRICLELGTLHRPRQGLLQTYVEYGFCGLPNQRFPVHFSLCASFLVVLMMRSKEAQSGAAARIAKKDNDNDSEEQGEELNNLPLSLEDVYCMSWWVFDISVKSIALEQHDLGALNAQIRYNVGSPDFLRLCQKLVSNCVKVMARNVKLLDVTATVQFNSNLAMFLLDLFSVCDRGHMIDVVWQYVTDMIAEQEAVSSSIVPLLKFDLIRILMDGENWVALNFPARLRGSSQAISFHQLTSAVSHAVVSDVFAAAACFADASASVSANDISATRQTRLAAAHYGVHVILGAFAKHDADVRYQDESARERLSQLYCSLVLTLVKAWPTFGSALSGCAPMAGVRRKLYLAVMWVMDGLKGSFLRRFWKELSETELASFWEMMQDAVAAFAWSPQWALELLPASATARSCFDRLAFSAPMAAATARNLCATVSLQVLDLMESFAASFDKDGDSSAVLELGGNTFVTLLMHNQGARVLHCVFDSLSAFSLRFRVQMWAHKAASAFAQGLMGQILRLCNSARDEIRAEAVMMLYLTLRANRAETGNFERSKVLATTALASLVATGQVQGGSYLKKAMATLSQYAMIEYQQAPEAVSASDKDLFAKAEFAQSVQSMSRGLCRVLDDTITVARVREREDAYTIAELYFDIVRGYDMVADLRITWLRSLSEFHKEKGREAEAGMCLLRAAMLVHNFFSQSAAVQSGMGHGKMLFEKIMPGVGEYADMTGDESCQTSWFTEEGYATTLEEAASCFTRAQMFEYAEDIYLHALLPLRQATRANAKVALCHRLLAALYQKIDTEGTTRFLGRYFRIGFYGTVFDELNGKEYVYRYPGAQHLFELKDELVEYFSAKLGVSVEVAKDSAPIPQSVREGDKPMLQITSLRAIFDAGPSALPAKRHLAEWIGVSKFAFDTPFQRTGKNAQAATSADQWKRTTMLEVRHSFPNVLARQLVLSRSEIEVSPIELAVEAISTRSAMISQELSRSVPQPLQLQQVLAGSVSVSVNSGPVEFCEVFLEKSDLYPPEHIASLRTSFKEFLYACRCALDLNKKLSRAAMAAFHDQMEIDFKKLQARILPALVGALQKKEEERELDI